MQINERTHTHTITQCKHGDGEEGIKKIWVKTVFQYSNNNLRNVS